MALVVLYLQFIVSPTNAFSSQTPGAANDSYPGGEGWTPEPTGRGTFEILSSCAVTLALCAWTVIHRDVYTNTPWWRRLSHKGLWMLMALVTPVTVLLKAYRQWRLARGVHQHWCGKRQVQPGSKEDILGMKGAFFVVMGGYTLRGVSESTQSPIAVAGFMSMVDYGMITDDALRTDDLRDKEKTDPLGKFVVCTQAGYMLVQISARRLIGLPITLLELHVVLQVVCAILMYAFWWSKPFDVIEPICILEPFNRDCAPFSPDREYWEEHDGPTICMECLSRENKRRIDNRVDPNLRKPFYVVQDQVAMFSRNTTISVVALLLYAGLHATAWHAHFPTTIECWLWRLSCIIIAAAPPLVLTMFIMRCCQCLNSILDLVTASYVILYLVSSAYLLVESFLSLRSVPVGTYQTVLWTNYFPHV